jgi:uncharacterized protein (TIGR03083 family)
MKDIDTIKPIDRNEMPKLAMDEYRRLFAQLQDLDAVDWDTQTVCDDWTVHLMVAHLLGAAEANASFVESLRQLRQGRKVAKEMGAEDIDGINAVQVEARKHLSPTELIDRLAAIAPKAVAGRRRTPRLARRMRVATGVGYDMTMGHLMDRVFTRDQWMHRIDIAAATGRELELSAEHDGRIVEDVILEWADRHGEPFELVLDGPAGGTYRSGNAGIRIEMDAIEFCLILSGRLDKPMPLTVPVVF